MVRRAVAPVLVFREKLTSEDVSVEPLDTRGPDLPGEPVIVLGGGGSLTQIPVKELARVSSMHIGPVFRAQALQAAPFGPSRVVPATREALSPLPSGRELAAAASAAPLQCRGTERA